MSENMTGWSPRREQPQAGVRGDLGIDSSASACELYGTCLGDEGKERRNVEREEE